jgi:hypothetical protein
VSGYKAELQVCYPHDEDFWTTRTGSALDVAGFTKRANELAAEGAEVRMRLRGSVVVSVPEYVTMMEGETA